MKTALITGASKRIGRAFALALANEGYALALHYNQSHKEAAKLAQEIEAKGGHAHAIGADLSNAAQTETLIEKSVKAIGPLNALINNASLFDHDSAQEFTAQTWDAQLAVNVRAPALLARDFAQSLPKDAKGCIINILDRIIARPSPAFFSYTISKTALATLTEILAQAYAPQIRVCGIAPGLTLPSGGQSQAQFNAVHDKTLLGHGSTPEALTQALLYLLSAQDVTGQVIYVDGGERYHAEHSHHDLIKTKNK